MIENSSHHRFQISALPVNHIVEYCCTLWHC